MILYAATGNAGKLAEFVHSAGTHAIQVLALPNLAHIPEPIEDATTFLGNAERKARAYSLTQPGKLVFADDSGLEVDALQGAPGVRSARYAEDFTRSQQTGSPASGPSNPGGLPLTLNGDKDSRNNQLLLHQLTHLPEAPRTARFRCALALARDGRILLHSEGTVEGAILLHPRGQAGFGYDPLFLIPSLGLTLAELPNEQKWNLSHRGNAFRALLSQLSDSTWGDNFR